jgi:putative hydrolase of the HAD superfamily
MPTHIIFDLGNVLINIHPDLAMNEFSEKCGIKPVEIRKFFLSDLHLGLMKGDYSPDEFFRIMINRYPCSIDEHSFQIIWNKVIGRAKRGIEDIIRELASSYSLGICSNTDPWHWQKVLHDIPFIKYFKQFFLSFEMKKNKPDPLIFEHILSSLGIPGQNCVFIDDTSENIEVAKTFGITGIVASEPREIQYELQRLKILE